MTICTSGMLHSLVHHFVNINANLFFQSRNKSEGVKSTAESVKKALNDAGRAQVAAEKAIQKARNDIRLTQNRLAQVKQLQLGISRIVMLLN